MNSPFATIYLAIMNRLQATVPEITYIDRDLGQLMGYSQRPAVAFPCALIDFQGWSFENWGDNVQGAEGDVIVTLGFAQHIDSSNLTETEWRENALAYWETEWEVNKALHCWSPGDDEGYLTRTGQSGENRPMGVRVQVMRYRLCLEDYSTATEKFIGQRPTLTVSS